MLKQKHILLLLFFFSFEACKAQSKDFQLNGNSFIEVKSWLIKFIREKEKPINDSSLFIVGLSNKFTYPLDLYKAVFVPGIYKFGSNFSHSATFLLIVSDNYSKILTDYNTINVLEEVINQIKCLKIIDNKQQLETIQSTILVLNQINH